ncbi:type IV secretory system conjugative DNA transfer family protein [Brevibacillus choshinensis]|uniref:type IV secretory system conjugative DNA transfer family protein n=1 Tax=Brevibacillus choshinensis TaxID=54911 RepID=UPI002E1EA038|nr:type IV secretory system conjugative DNA transfer family protein [Brevibacillus choshinensis]MED4779466.1 TraM recognition domain-containing protein [Brevibacillus choshinensis]
MSDKKSTIPTAPPISAFYRKFWVDNRERILQWYRLYFHTAFVTLLTFYNILLGYSGMILYLSQWAHKKAGPAAALSLFTEYPATWLTTIMDIFFIELDTWSIPWLLVILNLPIITWLYSTVTLSIVKGYKVLWSWRTRRGRIWSLILNGGAFLTLYCGFFAWYIEATMFDWFASITAPHAYLVVKSMQSFGYILMAVPVFICLVAFYSQLKQLFMNEDLQKQFFTWEFQLFASQSFNLKDDSCDVIVGWNAKTKKPIVLYESARYLHELVNGATGTGKTSTTILIRIVQDLIRIARGKKMGVVVLEPKGDLVRDVLKIASKLGIPTNKIKVVDPTDLMRSVKYNPVYGPLQKAAETFRSTIMALTANQDEFFKGQQEETASLYTMLGKMRYGDSFNIVTHLQAMFDDPRYLADITEQCRSSLTRQLDDPALTKQDKATLTLYDRVISYFENQVLEYKFITDREGNRLPLLYPEGHRHGGKRMVDSKKDKFVSGAKKYLNDLVMNDMLSELMAPKEGEEVLDLDKFLDEGGILLVNTALGELEELSLMFGQFFIRQFQSAVFRRPSPETGYKRCPVFFYVDEFPLYINEAFSRFLTLGRSYLVGTLIAIQDLGQLEQVLPGYSNTIMGSASNKTVFGRGTFEDNKRFSDEFGEEAVIEESLNESTTPVSMPNQSWGYRHNTSRVMAPRFTPTQIKELPFKHFIVQLVEDQIEATEKSAIRPPEHGFGLFVNETKFLRKFVNIGEIELETKNYKPLKIVDHLNLYKFIVANSLSNPSSSDSTIEKENQNHHEQEPNVETITELEVPDDMEVVFNPDYEDLTPLFEEQIPPEEVEEIIGMEEGGDSDEGWILVDSSSKTSHTAPQGSTESNPELEQRGSSSKAASSDTPGFAHSTIDNSMEARLHELLSAVNEEVAASRDDEHLPPKRENVVETPTKSSASLLDDLISDEFAIETSVRKDEPETPKVIIQEIYASKSVKQIDEDITDDI